MLRPSPLAGWTSGPLVGVRILDLCRLIPGGLATRKLADLGAEVVKVEDPGRGDYLREIPPFVQGRSLMHEIINRGKSSVALDLRQEEGQDIFRRLVAQADVLVEVSRHGALSERGIDLADLRRSHPGLVICSISGFGQSGPLAGLPAHGLNIDALAGCLTVVDADDGPSLGGVFNGLGGELGALNAAVTILAAIIRSRSTGEGAWIDISCWDAAVESLRLAVAHFVATGGDELHVADLGPLYAVYRCRDGRMVLFCPIERKFWEAFCQGVGRDDLTSCWGGDAAVDFGASDELRRTLTALFLGRTAQEWEERFIEWGIPGSPILALGDVLAHPHLRHRAIIDDAGGPFPTVGDPSLWMERDGAWRPGLAGRPSPALGQDTEEVLARWLSEPPA